MRLKASWVAALVNTTTANDYQTTRGQIPGDELSEEGQIAMDWREGLLGL